MGCGATKDVAGGREDEGFPRVLPMSTPQQEHLVCVLGSGGGRSGTDNDLVQYQQPGSRQGAATRAPLDTDTATPAGTAPSSATDDILHQTSLDRIYPHATTAAGSPTIARHPRPPQTSPPQSLSTKRAHNVAQLDEAAIGCSTPKTKTSTAHDNNHSTTQGTAATQEIIIQSSLSAATPNGQRHRPSGLQDSFAADNCDDILTPRSNHNDGSGRSGSSSGRGVPLLPEFHPAVCMVCHLGHARYTCRQCTFELCEECFFTGDTADHDPRHEMDAMSEHHCGNSRSNIMNATQSDSANQAELSVIAALDASCFLFEPCKNCQRPIVNEETVYKCKVCKEAQRFVVCAECFAANTFQHDAAHLPLQEFKWNVSDVKERQVTSKRRNNEGNKVINDYAVVRELGKGSFAKVKLLQHVETKLLYAVKILKKTRRGGGGGGGAALMISPRQRSSSITSNAPSQLDSPILREIAVMRILDHPNIVKLEEIIDDVESDKYYVIMEYCEGGPIHVLGKPALTTSQLRRVGHHIILGLRHLHDLGLYHRDIKPANCLMDAKKVVKLADFGACDMTHISKSTDGTPSFMCPELMAAETEGCDGIVADSWAFAVTMYQAAYGKLPYEARMYSELRALVTSSVEIAIPENGDQLLGDLLSHMLRKDLSHRIMIDQAAQHAFFSVDVSTASNKRTPDPSTASLFECMNTDDSSSPIEGALVVQSWSYAPPRSKQGPSFMNVDPMNASSPGGVPATNAQDLYARAFSMVKRGTKIHESFYGLKKVKEVRRRSLAVIQKSQPDEDNGSLMSPGPLSPSAPMSEPESDSFVMPPPVRLHGTETTGGRRRSNSMLPESSPTRSPRLNGVETLKMQVSDRMADKQQCISATKLPLGVVPAFLNAHGDRCRQLSLTECRIHSLKEFSSTAFRCLRDVDLSHNLLRTFPMELLRVPQIQLLDLSYNRIATFPDEITNVTFLERLSMHSNRVKDISPSALHGKHLKHVRLSDNPLTALPADASSVGNVRIVLDDAPAVVQQWEQLVTRQRSGGLVVVWNDAYPVQIVPELPWYVAAKPLGLYTVHQLRTLGVKHIVVPQVLNRQALSGGGNKSATSSLATTEDTIATPLTSALRSPVLSSVSPQSQPSISPRKERKNTRSQGPRVPLLDQHTAAVFDEIRYVDSRPSVEDVVVGLSKAIEALYHTGSPVLFAVDENLMASSHADVRAEARLQTKCIATSIVDSLCVHNKMSAEDAQEVLLAARRGVYA